MSRHIFLQGAKTLFALFLAVLLSLVFFTLGKFRLPKGNGGEFYLYESSSRAKITKNPRGLELLFVTGQCEGYEVENWEEFYRAVQREYRARLQFEEGEEYFFYSPLLQGGVRLDGYLVNLHLVRRGNAVKIGTPLVFGGY